MAVLPPSQFSDPPTSIVILLKTLRDACEVPKVWNTLLDPTNKLLMGPFNPTNATALDAMAPPVITKSEFWESCSGVRAPRFPPLSTITVDLSSFKGRYGPKEIIPAPP